MPEGYIGIYTVEDFDYVRNMGNGNFIMMNDIDMSGVDWISDIELTGTFDGNNYLIDNYSTPVSFFHKLENGTIKNLKMNVSVNGDLKDKMFNDNGTPNQDAFNFGTLVSVVHKYLDGSCEISNIDIDGNINVTNTANAGGIIGCIKQTNSAPNQNSFVGEIIVSDCIFRGNLTSDASNGIGGIIGSGYAPTLNVNNCVNAGKLVFEEAKCAGGIISNASNIIQNCSNYGDITGNASYAGGICGYSEGKDDGDGSKINLLTISGCYNSGKIDLPFAVSGGIVGDAGKVYQIENCLNEGSVIGDNAGGIAGANFSEGYLRNSCNLGTVSATNMAGALIGEYASGLGWLIAGALWCITIVGIPLGKQCFKFAKLTALPFGRDIIYIKALLKP